MKPNYQSMSKAELKAYVLEHRDDQEAFHAYMDKLATEPVLAVHTLLDDEPLSKVIEKVRRKQNQG